MKNIFRFFGALLTLVFTVSLAGCVEEQLESADVGLHIKVFFPTKVVAGQPMTINGSGFSDVTEVVFPGDVTVTDFEIVSNDMIRVKAPSGIPAEGGHIVVRTSEGDAESPLPLTLGSTIVTGCSTPEDGEAIEGGSQMTIYGSDLEFVTKIEMMDEDGNPVFVQAETFIRKSTETIIFVVPKKVYEGEVEIKLYTVDGNEVNNDKLPVLTYKPKADGGHFETVEHVLWENPDPAGLGENSWSGQYRFGLEGKDGNNECVATFPAETWDIIKNGTFRVQFAATNAQIRITTGWWSTTWTGADIMAGDERIIDNGDGTYYIEITLAGDPILDVIDEQHLLLTGGGYTPLKIYYTEEVWVGGTIEIVKTAFWKNEDPAGNGEISWNGKYRFGLEGHDGLNECIATFPQETWDIIKNGTFYMSFAATNAQLRITTGWWSTTWTGADIMAGDERIIDNGDGTYSIEINFAGDPILDLLDEQHLLFTGGGYTPLELYTQEEVLVGGDQPKEVVLWEGEAIADNWGNQPTILSDAGLELVDAGATAGQTLYFYFEPLEDAWQVKIIEGHWGPIYAAICSEGNDNNGEFTVYDLAGNGGKYALELTQEILDAALTQQWWGGAFLLNGDNIKCTKVTLM